jgi:hypothetical protein
LVIKLYCAEDREGPFFEIYKRTASDKGYAVVFPCMDSIKQPSYIKFTSIYRHMSINSIDFELACFRRYFLILPLLKPNEHFIISDSDLYFNTNKSEIPKAIMDFTHGLVGSVGITNGVLETDISPHFSFWTTELLKQFVDYLIYAYEERAHILESIYTERRQQKGKRVAVSDMTLLYDWVNTQGIPFLNSNQVTDGLYLDHNITMRECLNATFQSRFGRKRIYYGANGLRLQDTHNREVRPLFLHLPGRYKAVSTLLHDGKRFCTNLTSIYIYLGRSIRSLLDK